jgi:hypothetical protein
MRETCAVSYSLTTGCLLSLRIHLLVLSTFSMTTRKVIESECSLATSGHQPDPSSTCGAPSILSDIQSTSLARPPVHQGRPTSSPPAAPPDRQSTSLAWPPVHQLCPTSSSPPVCLASSPPAQPGLQPTRSARPPVHHQLRPTSSPPPAPLDRQSTSTA